MYKTLLSHSLGTHCPGRPARKATAEIQMLVEASSKPNDKGIYTGGSVTRASLVGDSQSSRVEGLYTKTVEPTESRSPA